MHTFAVVLIPHYVIHDDIRPLAARDAAVQARLELLLFRYEQPADQAWGVDYARGYRFDWWECGGHWDGWGRDVRALMGKQRLRPSPRTIPRFIQRNAVWSEDLGRVRLGSSVYPLAIVTPFGDWEECSVWPAFGDAATVRVRKAKAAWLRRIRKITRAFPSCLAVGIDYHW
jgi:hypothetical protein